MQRWTAGGPRHVIYSTLVILRRACWPAADQTLFVTGDEGDGCYRVEEGLLKASVAAATGGERILAILGPEPQAKAEIKSLPKAKSLKSGQCRKASRLCCSRTKPPI